MIGFVIYLEGEVKKKTKKNSLLMELSCMSCLYIFEINSLSVTLFAIIFSHSEGCLYTLLIVSFVVQKQA